jgi:hypothetical protein
MNMKRSLIILTLVSVFVSCSDDERDPFPFEKQVELLAGKPNESKTWLLESLTVNGTVATIADCDTDNAYTFYNNALQEYKITPGAQKCDEEELDLFEEGAWMMAKDGKTLIISGNKIYAYKNMNFFGAVSSRPGNILELTETTFRMEINVVDGVGADAANVLISLKTN